jgi:DNA repair protein RadC
MTTEWMPRERAMSEGLERLGDVDLVALLLGTGRPGQNVLELSTTLMSSHGGLAGLATLPPPFLRGAVGPARALRIAAAFELGRRAAVQHARPRARVTRSEDVAAYMRAQLSSLDHEEMWVLCLDGQNGVRAFRKVAQGGLHGCSVAARDVLRTVLLEAASGFVVCHNHPSGDPTPSPADVTMTLALAEAALQVGLTLVDHVLVARDKTTSFLDLGLLP